MSRWIRGLGLACLLAGMASSALAAKIYSDNGDGTVTDPSTGLTWMRCAMGRVWTGDTCTGTEDLYTWDQANALTGAVAFAGQGDWRLPNIRELQSIVDRTFYDPAIDPTVFPNTPSDSFWSASAYAYYPDRAWLVNFGYGDANYYYKSYSLQIRLVRGGQSLGSLLNPARPTSDYVDHGNGTVTHTPTGLMWQRCAKGQTWAGSTCSGSATEHTWDEAVAMTDSFGGQSDWRLPTEDELLTLVDYTTFNPAANATIFPAMRASYFWSASAYTSSLNFAWYVGFYFGDTSGYYKTGLFQVRFVRSAPPVGTSHALSVSRSGTGSGTVTSNPAGINCGALCIAFLASGTSVTLVATADAGSTFADWSGACSGTGACTVSMNQAQNVTATFTSVGYTLSVTKSGTGAGTVTASNFNCDSVCSVNYPTGTSVVLSATAGAGSTFTGWSSDCSGTTATCTVFMSQAQNVTAIFTADSGSSYTLSVAKSGTGSGGVTASSINCGAVCSVAYPSGTSVTLTATADAGSTFNGWSGAGCSGTSTCTISLNQAQSVTATFALATVSTVSPYDGIYQWDAGYYLSVHQIGGGTLIGTIYWVYSSNTEQVGTRAISEADTFDLFQGQLVGSTATMTGTRFYRGCTLSYDFTFNPDSSLGVRLNSVSNSPGVSVTDVDCAARYTPVGSVRTIPRIY